jgi:hypothetical protein
MRAGRTSAPVGHLLNDSPEVMAKTIMEKISIRARKCNNILFMVYADEGLNVQIVRDDSTKARVEKVPASRLVGTYTRQSHVKGIEEDLRCTADEWREILE